MSVLSEENRKQLVQVFAELLHPVRLVFFTQETECEYCAMTREMLRELVSLSEKLSFELHDFVADAGLAKEYRIDKLPALAVVGEQDYGIRFFGVPGGYEFTTLIEDIVDVGRRDPGLPAAVITELAKVDRPVRMQVMVLPTCVYCPRAVRAAHRLAMASPHITAEMIELTEFPQLAVKYNVQSVPKTIINDEYSLLGAQPEAELVKAVLQAVGKS